PTHRFRTYVISHFVPLQVLQEKAAGRLVRSIVIFEPDKGIRVHPQIIVVVAVRIAIVAAVPVYIDQLEIGPYLIGLRHPILTRQPEDQRQEYGAHHIRPQHPVVFDTPRQNGDELRPAGHLAREIDHRDKHHQRIDHRHNKRYEAYIIRRDQLPRRKTRPDEIIRLLARVDYHRDHRHDQHREQEGPQKLLQYVIIDQFEHRFRVFQPVAANLQPLSQHLALLPLPSLKITLQDMPPGLPHQP